MIPPFDDSGCLPPGIYGATLAEIEARFGRQSELRRVFGQSTGREPGDTPCPWARAHGSECAGVQRIVLNGSFVTDIMEPNDVDCVLLFEPGKGNRAARRELRKWPAPQNLIQQL